MNRRHQINVGLVGLGRLGTAYARDIATRIPEMRLVAVADTLPDIAERVAAQFGVPSWTPDPFELIGDPRVEAVVVTTPTRSHEAITLAALAQGKPTFCEKPPSVVLREAEAMRDAAGKSGTMLQIGFMRRFDSGYVKAKRQIDEGAIGTPVMFKSCSRDPSPPSLEYADPKSSGGTIVDMGIHDFDLARWLVCEVRSVHTIGGALACPEFRAIGDVDTAIVQLTFDDGRVGVVDLSRNAVYGYDVRTEILGTAGAVQVGYLRETPVLLLTRNSVAHDTVPHFPERFEKAYARQLQDFAVNVLENRTPQITIDDGIAALKIGLAAVRSYKTGQSVTVGDVHSNDVPA